MERQVQTGMADYTPAQRVALARNTARPGVVDFVQGLLTDFFEQKGDRLCGDDPSIYGGVGLFHGRPVTVIGHRKGKDLEERMACGIGACLGCAVALDRLINTTGDSNLCFRPLSPVLEAEACIVWKRYQIFSKAAETFLRELEESFGRRG